VRETGIQEESSLQEVKAFAKTRQSVPVLGLAQNNAEASTTQSKALFNAPGHYYLAAIAGSSKILTVDPHPAAPVVYLKNAIARALK
jgi:hypothetical protein